MLGAVVMQNDCVEKTRLAKEYELATSAFSQAVKKLSLRMGTSSKEKYAQLDRIADEARVNSERTRLALEQHIAVHGC